MYYDFKKAEKELEKEFDSINEIRDYNQKKVLEAFLITGLHQSIFILYQGMAMMIWAEKFWTKLLLKYLRQKKRW